MSILKGIVGAILAVGAVHGESKENQMKEYEIVQKPAMTIVGIECRVSNRSDSAPILIPKHWEKFYKEGISDKIPNKASGEVIALYCDYEGDYTKPYSLVIGCPVTAVDQVPKGMVVKTVPASTFAVYKATGEFPKSIVDTWGRVWRSTSLKRTYTGDYELYGEKFTAGEVDVLIAIEATR